MNIFKTALLATAALAASALPSFAQDAMPGHDMSAMGGESTMAAPLPEICLSAGDMAGDMPMDMQGDMDQAHMDLMAGMDETSKQMMNAMMVDDIDVAFVCGMIPHHQGAINMAKAELEHGDNQWAKDMAQMVIDAQEKEIADMVAWLEGEGAAE
ncbi:MAG: hypothetical protein JWQ22_2206 [Devosia sp.]|nr:hypothetical protein [Devosia sp.]